MRRVWTLALGFVFLGCATRPDICRRDPRYRSIKDDRSRGIPDTLYEENVDLLPSDDSRPRNCQTLVEAFWSTPYAVWFTSGDSDWATVVVRFAQAGGTSEETAELGESIAHRLAGLCERFLRDPPECERAGHDGVFFHVAHHVPGSGYLMRTFWSPPRDSIEGSFRLMLGAVRDYVLVPSDMRSVKLDDLLASALWLEQSLDRGRPDPDAVLCAEPPRSTRH